MNRLSRPNRPIFLKQQARANRRKAFISTSLLAGALFVYVGSGVFHQKEVETPPVTTTIERASEPVATPVALDSNFLYQVEHCFLPISVTYGYDLYISSGFRSAADQEALYQQGRTVNGHIVTNAPGGRSVHNYGLAIDFADHAYGMDVDWDRLGKIGKYCGLEHGDSGYIDLPHFQHVGGLSIDDLQAGKRPTDLTLPCPKMESENVTLTKKDLADCGAPDFTGNSGAVYKLDPNTYDERE